MMIWMNKESLLVYAPTKSTKNKNGKQIIIT